MVYHAGDDKLMTDLRNKIKGEGSYWTYFGYVVMYIALVILTITFTIEYLKRAIFLAFLTMISPLISLTYPLDKIKDGHAQAFSMWLKEYIFNCLIQPVRLLLYTIFIDSVLTLMDVNPSYAIVAMAFFRPAEKFIKKMFGFDQANTMSTLGAAAGGAMVMNMLNKMQGRPPAQGGAGAGGGSHGGGKPNGVRTANNAPTTGGTVAPTPIPLSGGSGGRTGGAGGAGAGGTGSAGGFGGTGGAGAGGTGGAGGFGGTGGTGAGGTGGAGGFGGAGGTGAGGAGGAGGFGGAGGAGAGGTGGAGGFSGTGGAAAATASTSRVPTPSRLSGLKALGRKIAGPDAIKSSGKWMMKKGIRAAGAFAGATLGLAAGLADGSFEVPIRNMAIGATVGAKGAENLAGNITNGVKNTWESASETYNRGKYGEEAYNNMQFDKQFFKSDDYKQITQDPSINQSNIKQRVQQFLNNGITDGSKMREALQAGVSGDEYAVYSKAGITSTSDMTKLSRAGIPLNTVKEYGNNSITNARDIERLATASIAPAQVQGYRDAGINSVSDIITLNSSGVTADAYKNYEALGVKNVSQVQALGSAGISPTDFQVYASADIKNVSKVVDVARKHPGMSHQSRANWMNLAKHAPKTINDFKAMMVGRTFDGRNVTEDEAENIFRRLVDFF